MPTEVTIKIKLPVMAIFKRKTMPKNKLTIDVIVAIQETGGPTRIFSING